MSESGIAHSWVDDTARVDEVIDAAIDAGRYAIDTEFHRERTYYPALALVQIAVGDDIWLIDSESTDRTVEIAESLGVNVVVRPWPGYVNQWNYALSELPLQHPYVLLLDADEERLL